MATNLLPLYRTLRNCGATQDFKNPGSKKNESFLRQQDFYKDKKKHQKKSTMAAKGVIFIFGGNQTGQITSRIKFRADGNNVATNYISAIYIFTKNQIPFADANKK